MKTRIFPYAPWTKWFGVILIVIGFVSFFVRHQKNGVFDFNELAIGFCFGFLFIFFSREKADDEMVHHLSSGHSPGRLSLLFFLQMYTITSF